MAGNDSETSLYWARMFRNYKYCYAVGYPIITLISIVGTSALVTVMLTKRKQIRYPATTNWAICWLLVTDMIYLITRFIIYLGVTKILPNRLINVSEGVCRWWVVTFGAFAVMQGFVQSIISIERLLAIRRPLKVKLWVTPRRILIALTVVSIMSVFLAAGYMILGYNYDYTKHMCELNYGKSFEMAIHIFFCWTAAPCIILTFCATGIITKLMARSKSKLSFRKEGNLTKPEIRLSMMLVVMDIIFVCTSLPLSVVYFALDASQFSTRMQLAWRISLWLTSMGTYTDWIIVLVLGGQVRRAMRTACGCCCCCRNTKSEPSTSSGRTHLTSLSIATVSQAIQRQGQSLSE